MTLRSKNFYVNFGEPHLELWGNLVKMKVGNRAEEVHVKLYMESRDETPDKCLAEGKIVLSENTQQSWKTFPKEVVLMTT
jgi:hypothetical protein